MFEENTATGGSRQVTTDRPTPVGLQFGRDRTVAARPGEGSLDSSVVPTCVATTHDGVGDETHPLGANTRPTDSSNRVQIEIPSESATENGRSDCVRSIVSSFIDAEAIPPNAGVVYAASTRSDDYASILEPMLEDHGSGQLLRVFPSSFCGSIPAVGDALEALSELYMTVELGSTALDVCVYRRGERVVPFSTMSVSGTPFARRTGSEGTHTGPGRRNRLMWGGRAPLMEYISDVVASIANEFLPQLARQSITLYKQVLDRPIVCAGTMAAIPGLRGALQEALGTELRRDVSLIVPGHPETAGARGAQRIAARLIEMNHC